MEGVQHIENAIKHLLIQSPSTITSIKVGINHVFSTSTRYCAWKAKMLNETGNMKERISDIETPNNIFIFENILGMLEKTPKLEYLLSNFSNLSLMEQLIRSSSLPFELSLLLTVPVINVAKDHADQGFELFEQQYQHLVKLMEFEIHVSPQTQV